MITVPLYLVSLAVGYWVLTISQNQQKPLDIVGRIIGGLILLAALGGLICTAMCRMSDGSCGGPMCGMRSAAAHCGMMGGPKAGCPMMEGHQDMEKAPGK